MADVTKLLSASNEVDFLCRLEPTSKEWEDLEGAKAKIRMCLREVFNTGAKKLLGTAGLRPGFFTQGSAAYKTLNRPPFIPPQMDFDDGMYLPMSFMQNVPRPSVAAAAFFEVVDAALANLAKSEGWKFDDSKATCCRVIISDKAHIDVPLYAIPDAEFGTLTKAMKSYGMRLDEDIDFLEAARRPDAWHLLPSDKVLLAHRIEDWKPSDPRKIHSWFLDAVATFGEQLRRQCRFLKAWRDQHGLTSLPSILIMACVWRVYDELQPSQMPKRDDLALAKIAARIPELLGGKIENPTDPAEHLDDKLSDEDRKTIIAEARELAEQINSIVGQCYNPEAAIKLLRAAFGSRIADRPDLVKVEKLAATVLSRAPVYLPSPEVRRSHSG